MEKYIIKPKATVHKLGQYGPESVSFSSTMARLKLYLGLGQRHDQAYEGSRLDDYFFFLGVSGEGFALKFNITDVLFKDSWGMQAIEDCFRVEGIQYRFVTDFGDDIEEEVSAHIRRDLPVLRMGTGGKTYILTESPVEKGSLTVATKALIFIEGVGEKANRKEIIFSALRRGYEMLTETGRSYGEYGYGSRIYDKWLKKYENEEKLAKELTELSLWSPKIKFDLAERRAYLSNFFKMCEVDLGEGTLQGAIDSFNEIHELAYSIHHAVKHRETNKYGVRDEVIGYINQCRECDLKAAEDIKCLLEKSPEQLKQYINDKKAAKELSLLKARIAEIEYIFELLREDGVEVPIIPNSNISYETELSQAHERLSELEITLKQLQEKGVKIPDVLRVGTWEDGMENGDASSDGEPATLILVRLGYGKQYESLMFAMSDVTKIENFSFVLKITPEGGETKTISMPLASQSFRAALLRFEPVYSGFTPLKDVKYKITLDIRNKASGERWHVITTGSHVLREDAIVLETEKFDNIVKVIDMAGKSLNDTYLRRARGLVKDGRAEWVDEKTIRILG